MKGKDQREKPLDEEKNGSEELVEKKVCKGFQTALKTNVLDFIL